MTEHPATFVLDFVAFGGGMLAVAGPVAVGFYLWHLACRRQERRRNEEATRRWDEDRWLRAVSGSRKRR